ncbi:MAG: N-acetylmuramoyl-L-alanine amidase [Verrucomicrobia bacterium]|nr:N-acetylmuramoyl-L-alanine amidase [Verrucomicrobiota bacterium]
MVTHPGTIPDARQRLNIMVDFVPVGNSNRPGAPLKPAQITIHNTDNSAAGADAQAHAIYQKGPDARARKVSWHFTVDDHSVYQSLPVNEVGWHTATYQGNYSTIGIEICENDGIDQLAANDRAALLTAIQLHELGIPLQGNVVQHFDWSGKNCPALLRNPLSNWEDFLARVAFYYDQIQLDSPDVDHSANLNPSPTFAPADPASLAPSVSESVVHNVTGSSFADLADVATYERCKANGGSEEYCLGIGDNGIGYWGDDTKHGSGASCALSPEWMVATWGNVAAAHLQPVLISNPHNGQTVTALIKDTLPHYSPRIDMNPDTCAALALTPPVLAPVTWQAIS